MPILAQQYPVFQAAMRVISNITNATEAVVTTTFAHQYVTGLFCRLYVPAGYGMTQVNQMYAEIGVIDATNFFILIDTTMFDIFTIPGSYPNSSQYATVVPIGNYTLPTIYDPTMVGGLEYIVVPDPTRNVLPYPLPD